MQHLQLDLFSDDYKTLNSMPPKRTSNKIQSLPATKSRAGSNKKGKSKRRKAKSPPLAVVKRSEAGQVAEFVDDRAQETEIRYDLDQVLPKSQSRFSLTSLFQNAALVTTLTGFFSTLPKK